MEQGRTFQEVAKLPNVLLEQISDSCNRSNRTSKGLLITFPIVKIIINDSALGKKISGQKILLTKRTSKKLDDLHELLINVYLYGNVNLKE